MALVSPLDGGGRGRRKSGITSPLDRKKASGGLSSPLDRDTAPSGGGGGGFLGALGRSPVGKALEVLDLPKSLAVAIVKELNELDLPGPRIGKDTREDKSFDLADIAENTKQHVGFGDVLQTGNKWADRAIGFTGDVGLDPLTYLTLGAAPIVKAAGGKTLGGSTRLVTKQTVARSIAKAAADGADEATMRELTTLAEKVARRGTGSLTKQQAADAGTKQGAALAGVMIPGTGAVARALDKVNPQAAVRESLYGGKLGEKVVDQLGKHDPNMNLSRTGLPYADQFSPAGPLHRIQLLDATRLAKGEARAASMAARDALKQVKDEYRDIDRQALRDALQGANVTDAAVREAVVKVRGILDDARARAAEVAGRDLGYIENYLPVQFSRELAELIARKKGRTLPVSTTAKVTKQRETFVAGGQFLGETLEGATPHEVLRHAETIAQRKFGEDALSLFEKDPFALVNRAISSYERFAMKEGTARNLLGRPEALAPDGWTTTQGAHAEAPLADLANEGPRARNSRILDELGDEAGDVDLGTGAERVSATRQAFELREAGEKLYDEAEALATTPGLERGAASTSLQADAFREAAELKPVSIDEAREHLQEKGFEIADSAVSALRTLASPDEPWVAEALYNLDKMSAFRDRGAWGKTVDKINQHFKSQALLSPGFHLRNFGGGVFSNALKGVDIDMYRIYFLQVRKFKEGGWKAVDPEYQRAFASMEKYGLRNAEAGRSFSDLEPNASGRGFFSINNPLFRLNMSAGHRVENGLRGTLFLDVMQKGGLPEDALEAVGRHHFFYDETSPFFKNYIKRAVPFATWSRFNFGLQIEGMIRRPGRYTRWTHFGANLDSGDEDVERPDWLKSLLAIHLPFKSPGDENNMFLTLDLPYRDLNESFNLEKNLSSMTPLFKVPAEQMRGKTFFNDQRLATERETPAAWLPLVAALHALGPVTDKLMLPRVDKVDGGYVMETGQANKIANFLPLLGRLRRLFPSDDYSQAKALSSWISFVGGVSNQTIVENEKHVKAAGKELTRKSRKGGGDSSPASARPSSPKSRTVEESYRLAKRQLGID